ncbi:helix-turn-helix domain-containing protein [Fodinicola feengrottensis]|nr:helix-turn-helix domain-containing protein [Fodinicola feengrottensis]
MAIAAEIDEVVKLNLAGHSYRAIGRRLGISHETVSRRVTAGIAQIVIPAATEMRKVELERLDGYLLALQPAIERGDDKAITTALRIQERRARYLGLDAALELSVQHTFPGTVEDEIARLEAELALNDAHEVASG